MRFETRFHLHRASICGSEFLPNGMNGWICQEIRSFIFGSLQIADQALTACVVEAEMTEGLCQSRLIFNPTCIRIHFAIRARDHRLNQTPLPITADTRPDFGHVEIEPLAIVELLVICVAVGSVVSVERGHDGSSLFCCRYVSLESARLEHASRLEHFLDS